MKLKQKLSLFRRFFLNESINKVNVGSQHETRMEQVTLMHEYAFSYYSLGYLLITNYDDIIIFSMLHKYINYTNFIKYMNKYINRIVIETN